MDPGRPATGGMVERRRGSGGCSVPATYRVDPTNRVVWTRFWGRVTVDEMAACALGLRADARFDPAGKQLLMFSDADPALITLNGVRHVANLTGWGPGSRRAMVMRSAVGMGLGRQFALLTGRPPEEVATFLDLGAALAWLGLPPDWEPPAASPDDPVFEIPPG
jgi:hypothetical protein